MRREEGGDRHRGGLKLRFNRRKIIFDSGNRKARGREKLKKSEQSRDRDQRKRK
jgi:hypothetical protein